MFKEIHSQEGPYAVMPDFPIDDSEDILQENEESEGDDIPEMDEEDD